MHVCIVEVCTYVCVYVRMFVCLMYVRMYVLTYVCTYVCTNVCMYEYKSYLQEYLYTTIVVILHAYIKNFQNKTEARFACWLSVWASKKMGKIVAILSVSACSI